MARRASGSDVAYQHLRDVLPEDGRIESRRTRYGKAGAPLDNTNVNARQCQLARQH
jgi:hypothetical protein